MSTTQPSLQAMLNYNPLQDVRIIKIFNAEISTTRQVPEEDKIATPTPRIVYFDNSQIQTSFTFKFLVSHLPVNCRYIILGLTRQMDAINYIRFSKSEQAQQHATNIQLQYMQLGSIVNDPSNVTMANNAMPFFSIKRKEYFWIKSGKICEPLVAMLLFADERQQIKSFCFAMKDIYILSEKRGAVAATTKIDSSLVSFPNSTADATLHHKVECLVLHEKQTQIFGYTEQDRQRQQAQQAQQQQQQAQPQQASPHVAQNNLLKLPVGMIPLTQHQQQQNLQLFQQHQAVASPFNSATFAQIIQSPASSSVSSPGLLNVSPLAGFAAASSAVTSPSYNSLQDCAFQFGEGLSHMSHQAAPTHCVFASTMTALLAQEDAPYLQPSSLSYPSNNNNNEHHQYVCEAASEIDDFVNGLLADSNENVINSTIMEDRFPDHTKAAIAKLPNSFDLGVLALFEKDKKIPSSLPKQTSNGGEEQAKDKMEEEEEETTVKGILSDMLPKGGVATIMGKDIVSITIDANKQMKLRRNAEDASGNSAAAAAAAVAVGSDQVTSHVGICGHVTYSTVLYNKNRKSYFVYSIVEKLMFNKKKKQGVEDEQCEEHAVLNEGEQVTLNFQIKDNADVELETQYYKSEMGATNPVDKTGYVIATITLLAQVVQFNTRTRQVFTSKNQAKPATKKLYYNVINSANTRQALVEVPPQSPNPSQSQQMIQQQMQALKL